MKPLVIFISFDRLFVKNPNAMSFKSVYQIWYTYINWYENDVHTHSSVIKIKLMLWVFSFVLSSVHIQ